MTEEISSKIDELERRRVDLEGKSEVERQKIAPNEEKAEKDSRFWRPLNTAFQADPEKYRKRAEESQAGRRFKAGSRQGSRGNHCFADPAPGRDAAD